MIILLGPDGTGKSTLTSKLSLRVEGGSFHCTRETKESHYLSILNNSVSRNLVWDRFMFCEPVYSRVLQRKPLFDLRQTHNVILLGLMHKPVIVLCTHYPEAGYEQDVLPAELWHNCLDGYRNFLDGECITYEQFDHAHQDEETFINHIIALSDANTASMKWWYPMLDQGTGATGSPHPKILIVAERLGPNNAHLIPFETGPTGYMLAALIDRMKIPLGHLAITNMVKAGLRDDRPVNSTDFQLFDIELEHLKPDVVVFMGKEAAAGKKITKRLGIKSTQVKHLGYFNHKGITDTSYIAMLYDRAITFELGNWRAHKGV